MRRTEGQNPNDSGSQGRVYGSGEGGDQGKVEKIYLTPRQLRIYRFIQRYRAEYGYSPIMQEIADALECSKVTVFEHVEALIRKGALTRETYKARSLRPLSELNGGCCPWCGQVMEMEGGEHDG